MAEFSADEQFAQFLGRYSPEIVERAGRILKAVRKRLPGAVELVYDNYNALVIGFGPDEKTSHAVFSLAFYPRWISLFFLQARDLEDPDGLLRGQGTVARHIVLDDVKAFEDARVQALMARALEVAAAAFPKGAKRRMVIKSVSAKQRPRVPATKKKQERT